jgi:putative acetyltransferase
MKTIEIREASAPADFQAARVLFEEYAQGLQVDLCFQDFENELTQLGAMYGPPAGALLLAFRKDVAVGCAGVRRIFADTCEMKRLYVRETARAEGLGRRLALEALASGTRLGYRRMVLDTLATMAAARSLYRSLGFTEIPPYYSSPIVDATYLEKLL